MSRLLLAVLNDEVIFAIYVCLKNVFANKTERNFAYSDCQKLEAVTENFPLGGAKIFDRGFKRSLNIVVCNRTWSALCH